MGMSSAKAADCCALTNLQAALFLRMLETFTVLNPPSSNGPTLEKEKLTKFKSCNSDHLESHVLYDDALCNEAARDSTNTRDVEELVNLKLRQLLLQLARLDLTNAWRKQVEELLHSLQSSSLNAGHTEDGDDIVFELVRSCSYTVITRLDHKGHLAGTS